MRVIVSGGGTAGHIYPALAVADVLRERGVEILFVGAVGKMEMERVPANGYRIEGVPVAGLQRKLSLSALVANAKVPFKLWRSMRKAKSIIRNFAPDVVVGFGGFASAPIVRAAQKMGVVTVVQEQNSFAGLTNRMLCKKAAVICTAYEGMERFFPAERIVLTGNPLRGNIAALPPRSEALAHFGLDAARRTILVTGGSLGTRTLNEMMAAYIQEANLEGASCQFIWQTGRYYFDEFTARVQPSAWVKMMPFIEGMGYAYAAADVVICRSGASTVSELQLLGLPPVFVPSPNVAEDHQTANARMVVERGAAVLVADSQAVQEAIPAALALLADGERLHKMGENLRAMGRANAAADVADIVMSFRERNVYFVGIGGIGMSALARFFHHEGFSVAGYDRVKTPLTEALQSEGIDVHYTDDMALVEPKFKNRDSTRIIYTPAVPAEHSELSYFRQNGFEVVKRSRALGILCEGKYTMAVAGTHGKSTTTTLVAWINHCAANDGSGSAFLGAISKNFGTNLVMGSGERIAVEADEFDRSFHALHPAVSLITATDPDHLDIYGTASAFADAFAQFAAQTSDAVIVKYGVEVATEPSQKRFSYSLDNCAADYYAANIVLEGGGHYRFDIVTPTRTIANCRLGIVGLINVENAVGAVALCDQRGVDDDKVQYALDSFKGIVRRFDVWVNAPDRVYMDDYAHHPQELRNMLSSTRKMFPNRHITICFQPHLYTRTRDFATQFADSLSMADRVLLLPIYPARELPIEGVSSNIIYDPITSDKRLLTHKDDLPSVLASLPTDIVITAGAGDIDTLREAVAQIIQTK